MELLDWTARQIVTGKRGATPEDAPPIFERLKIKSAVLTTGLLPYDWPSLAGDTLTELFHIHIGT